jgi:hypothetical protein
MRKKLTRSLKKSSARVHQPWTALRIPRIEQGRYQNIVKLELTGASATLQSMPLGLGSPEGGPCPVKWSIGYVGEFGALLMCRSVIEQKVEDLLSDLVLTATWRRSLQAGKRGMKQAKTTDESRKRKKEKQPGLVRRKQEIETPQKALLVRSYLHRIRSSSSNSARGVQGGPASKQQ